MSNILEEYLVRIGAEVDKEAFKGAASAVNSLAGTMDKFAKMLKYSAAFALIRKVTDAVVDNIRVVAAADLEYQKFAARMWTTKETAKALTMVLKTMGATQEDVAWVPELREQFFRLRREMELLATPDDAAGQLRWIREIGYDVQSLQLKLKMLREWIAYYLIKYLKPYIKELQDFIRWLGEKLGNNLPKLAEKIASFLARVVSVGVTLGKLFKKVFEGIYNFFEAMPAKSQKLVTVLAAAGAAIMAGPFGMITAAIGGALLLLEDFFYYLEGNKSSKSLAPLWRWLTVADSKGISTLNKIKEVVNSIINRLTDFLTRVFNDDIRADLVRTAKALATSVVDMAAGIANIFKLITKNSPSVNNFWGGFAEAVKKSITALTFLGRTTAKIFSAMGLAMQGEFSLAKKELLGIIADFKDSKNKIIGDYGGDKAKTAYRYFVSQGLSKEAAAGLVGNFMQESSMNESAIGDDGTSGGIAQWHNERWEALKEFADKNGTKWYDFATQLAFVMHELKTTQTDTYNRLRFAESAEEAAQIVSDYFERPHPDYANNQQRRDNAAAVYQGGDSVNNSVVSPMSYAAGYPKSIPLTQTAYSGTFNVGGIVINCSDGAKAKEIAAAVGDTLTDIQQRLQARGGGSVIV